MKKFLVSVMMMAMVAVMLPLSVLAQDYCRKSYRSSRYSNAYYGGYNNGGRYRRSYNRSRSYRQPVYYNSYQPAYYSTGRTYSRYSNRPSFYRSHRNVLNMAIGTGGGAILGGLLGGRRGAGIGALLGAGGSALYTYKLNPKNRRYYRR